MALFLTLLFCALLAIGLVITAGVFFYILTDSVVCAVFLSAVIGSVLALIFFV